jgi:hypothetical protein
VSAASKRRGGASAPRSDTRIRAVTKSVVPSPLPQGKAELTGVIGEELENLARHLMMVRRAVAHAVQLYKIDGNSEFARWKYEEACDALCEADNDLEMLTSALENKLAPSGGVL